MEKDFALIYEANINAIFENIKIKLNEETVGDKIKLNEETVEDKIK